jgi:hypothetical protein
MYCSLCGARNDDDSQYCGQCGRDIKKQVFATPQLKGIFNKWGLIDKRGRFVVNPRFDSTSAFLILEEPMPVWVNGKWGYIDKTGRYVINPQFEQANPFMNGLGQVQLGNKIGYVDRMGKYVWMPSE